MGKKMMEITEFTKDLKNRKASLKLLDTNFTQLIRKITTDPGADYVTAAASDPLSKEVLVSLCTAQLALKTRLQNLFSAYNTWITANVGTIPALENFSYTFTSAVDWASALVADETLADYNLLKKIVDPEKELYESGQYWYLNHLEANIESIKTWSMNRKYQSVMDYVTAAFSTGSWSMYQDWSVVSTINGVTCSIVSGGDGHSYCTFKVDGIENIPTGTTAVATIKCYYWDFQYDRWRTAYGYINLQNTEIDNDGSVVVTATKGDYMNSCSVSSYAYNGQNAAHFDTESPTYTWLNSRVII